MGFIFGTARGFLFPRRGAVWPGGRDRKGETAALQLQVRLNDPTGQLEGPALQAGRTPDRATPYGPDTQPAGSLTLSDLGDFRLEEREPSSAQGRYFLTPYQAGLSLYTAEVQPLDLISWLSREVERMGERRVWVGKGPPERRHPPVGDLLPGRLAPSPDRRAGGVADPQEAVVRWRVRWPIEILFKVWKSRPRLAEWRSRNIGRIRCELYAKGIGRVIPHWIWRTEWPPFPDRSLFKAFPAVQKLALWLGLAWRKGEGVKAIIGLFQQAFRTADRQNRRRSKPATDPLLLALDQKGALT